MKDESKRKREKVSVSISIETMDKVRELRNVVIVNAIDSGKAIISFSSLVNELLDSGLEHRGRELWT